MADTRMESLFNEQNWEKLQNLLTEKPSPEIAEMLSTMRKTHRVLLYHALPFPQSFEVFSYLEPDIQDSLLTELTDQEARELLAKLRPDDRTVLLEDLPRQTTMRLLSLLSPPDLIEARKLLGYPEESVGRLMTPDFVSVLPSWTIERAFQHIRRKGREAETIGIIYVTDAQEKLLNALGLERLVLAAPSATIESIMDHSFVSLTPEEDREEAVRTMQKYDLFALPVVDTNGVLLGIVTADDVFDVATEEATEDIQKGAAVEPLKMSYREASVWGLYQKRIPWLIGLVVVNLGASVVLAAYEEILASAIALVFFIPLLMASGGNTGTQAATLMVRALATEDVKGSQWIKVLGKEVGVGSLLGITMGMGVGIIGFGRSDWSIGLAVGLATTAFVLVSNLIGVLFPVALNFFRIDPAVASSPMVTSTADVTSLLLYFSIATVIIGGGTGWWM
ncbi:magnesium transporter [uncultured Nitrospira sp.]|uniref:magnesium transporter n=1 Tax=uncultured Nitrospira sp. TaxID=157176 RepID=UPI0031404D18